MGVCGRVHLQALGQQARALGPRNLRNVSARSDFVSRETS